MHKIKKNIFFLLCIKYLKLLLRHLLKTAFYTLKVNKTDNKSVLCMKMIDIQKKLDAKNIHDLVDEESKGKFKTNNITDEHIKKCKRHGSELIDGEKYILTKAL